MRIDEKDQKFGIWRRGLQETFAYFDIVSDKIVQWMDPIDSKSVFFCTQRCLDGVETKVKVVLEVEYYTFDLLVVTQNALVTEI